MTTNFTTLRPLLQSGNFRALFGELGWDNLRLTVPIEVDGETFRLEGIAHKKGVQVFVCPPGKDSRVPRSAVRARIDTVLRKSAHEHLIIFVDGHTPPRHQLWQWAQVEPGRPRRLKEDAYHAGQSGDRLLQKLDQIKFELNEEEELTLAGHVLKRLQEAFGRRDKVTKKFFERFQQEHRAFLGFIQGIAAQGDRDWYASVMLNRLMFVYFIQKKKFLDGDIDYLGNRLRRVQAERGRGQFHSFYRAFLRKLFHGGLGTPEGVRESGIEALIGKVPYLNGGIFEPHRLERENGDIDIPDEAFEKVFAFFDSYDWHLDDRPLRNDREINPDVLGYIFEKYINQKQMGAYYTKEDITEYITKNTVLPFLLERTRENCKVAFQPGGPVWSLLANDPDRYIYPAVRHGVVDADGNVVPLLGDIERGVADVSQRGGWNRAAPEPYNLPTETWREYVARRQRCLDLREKLRNGEVTEVNDLITDNLNIRQFAQDVIEQSEGPDVVKAFYDALEAVSVLDPTCGSGAFLFAALQILEPLYEACLDRMEAWLADEERLDRKHPGHRFETILNAVEGHTNREYFIYKSIIINNLYGVDLMEEAVEICKLRLFLKLVSTVETADDVEPLPDVDFNIRAGNTLVGFTSLEAVREAMRANQAGQGKLVFGEDEAELQDIEEGAAFADRAYRHFRDQQTAYGGAVTAADKQALRARLEELDEKLNRHLARQYGIDPADAKDFEQWKASHQPLHWFVEFHEVMARGGFDAIVGNPPYVELRDLAEYRLHGFSCADSGNLYALVMERCDGLSGLLGRQGFIVPVSSISTDRYATLQSLIAMRELHYSSYDDRPSRLFDGLEHSRLAIHLLGRRVPQPNMFSTRYHKWSSAERPVLFENLRYVEARPGLVPGALPKLTSPLEADLVRHLAALSPLANYLRKTGFPVNYSRKVGYFLQVLDFEPRVLDGRGKPRPPSEFKTVYLSSASEAAATLCHLNSGLFYWFVHAYSDCRHVNKREVEALPVGLESLDASQREDFSVLAKRLMDDVRSHSENRVMRFGHDTLTVQHIFPRFSKPTLDEIDVLIGSRLGLSEEHVDFIINYDIKYRMGADDGADGGD